MNGSGQESAGLRARSAAGPRPAAPAPEAPTRPVPVVPGRQVRAVGAAEEPPPPPRAPGRSIVASGPARPVVPPPAPAPRSEPARPADRGTEPARSASGGGSRTASGDATPRTAERPAERSTARTAERTPARRAASSQREPAAPRRRSEPARRRRERVEVPEDRLLYLSVGEAARRTGASASSIRAWVRTGQVRTRTGTGARGERLEVALGDVEAALARRVLPPAASEERAVPEALALPAAPERPDEEGERQPEPAAARPRKEASRRRRSTTTSPTQGDDGVNPDAQLVPMTTVEAMERLSGELYLAGQRAARAEAVAELRERRLADLQQEVEDLQREATALWEQNQELLRRVALAEAQVQAAQAAPARQADEPVRWRLRR